MTPPSAAPLAELQARFAAAAEQAARVAFPGATIALDPAAVTTELPNRELGDLALPCFSLAKPLHKPPAQIAQAVAQHLQPDDLIASAAAAGPYVNAVLHRGAATALIARAMLAAGADYGRVPAARSERVMVEYSSPNTNKPQHLGHVRNNTIGMALSNLLTARGHVVIRCNLVNDRGIHICKSMLAYQRFGNGETPATTGEKGDHFVGRYYVRFQQEVERDPTLQQQAEEMLRRWEAGDENVRALWRTMNGWVYDGFRRTYADYGCVFDVWYYESDTYALGKDIVLEGLARGIFTRREDGAVIADLSGAGLDSDVKVLLRADGTSVYVTQDLGTAVKKFDDHRLDRSIYVTGSEQNNHFQVLFTLLARLGYPWADGCRHYSYGMVYLPEGKMKSREGKVVDADDLLAQLRDTARALIRDKHPDLDDADLDARARQVALAAIKYFILRVDPARDIHFDPEQELKFQGNTGPYLQYAHVRICGILRKAGLDVDTAAGASADYASLDSQADFDLALALARYPAVVTQAAESLNPALVAAYLYELAKSFTRFYDASPVLDAPAELRAARLGLIALAARVLNSGLALLGIDAPDRM